MAQKKHLDYALVVIISILVIWGIFHLAIVSFPFSLEKYGNSWHYFLHQLLVGFLPGLLVAFILFKLKLETLKKISVYLFGLNLLLLILVFFPKIGVEINGSRRWLRFGSIMFQPSEFLKITFLLYLSTWLGNKLNFKKGTVRKKKMDKQAFFVFVSLISMVVIILLFQRSFTTLITVGLIGMVIYFASFHSWKYFISLMILGAGLVVLGIKLVPYRLARVLTLLNPHIDPLGGGYQLKQSLIAIGSGKLFGIEQGIALGLSRQKFGFLPEVMTDATFAIIAEEMGFIGCSALILLFVLLAWKGVRIALRSKNGCYKLLAFGITFWLVFQAFFNISGIIGILPLVGIPLPFFSYGSSHLITEIAGLGLLLNISKNL